MGEIPQQVSQSTRRRNPHLYGQLTDPALIERCKHGHPKSGKRIKQRGRQPTKIELEWHRILMAQYPNFPRPRSQAITFVLANGVRYSPDEFAVSWPQETGPSLPTCWEVKGKWVDGDAFVKLKMAAHEWPEVRWILVWKEDGQWKQQIVLP
jgi:hypothetical protein